MPYQILKPIRFDRQYYIGDIITEETIDPGRVADLRMMGFLTRTENKKKDSVIDPKEPLKKGVEK